MLRLIAPALVVLATPALAHQGLHHHPHGIEAGWLVAALIGLAGGFVLSRLGRRK
jgi:hypothetical protein